MLKKLIKNVLLVLIPALILLLVIIRYNEYLDNHIKEEYNSALGRTYGVDEMNKGIKLLENNTLKDDLILLGSSELANADYIEQNPANMFPNADFNSDVCLVGRAGVQSLLNCIKAGALSESFKNRKVVFIVSPQWFLDEEIDKAAYKSNFSTLQFYKFMNNKKIDNNIKKYVCDRTVKLADNESSLAIPYLYSYLHSENNFISKLAAAVLKPYYFTHEKFLELKDKHTSYKAVKKFKNHPAQNVQKINGREEIKAQESGEKECKNNNFYVYDDYYTTYLEPKIDKIKDLYKDVDLCKSKEIHDYRAILEVFAQTGVRPYIVLVSANGYYYDYTGLTQDKRAALYDKLETMTDEYKFDYLDLRKYEYEPYFFQDVMHLGWKGWLHVNKQIMEHFA